ncbi:MAG: response regulator [Candidatus Omnitrophica bacterium]|nr:response regulator [Candidatus Omnitrophota bacterium]
MDKQGKILVIDDDQVITKMLYIKLTAQGYTVETAKDGEEGLEKYKTFFPDIIILDIFMPKMDGYTFVLEFNRIGNLKETSIIVLTAAEAMQDIFEMEGVNDYIVKPFNTEGLLRKIDKRMKGKVKKIMVVDDEPDFVNVVGNRLARNGYDVIAAMNGLDGLELARTEKPDLIVLDVMMPRLDGFRFCRMLKFEEKYKDIPIILSTALLEERGLETSKRVRADAYLTKSYDCRSLLGVVKELLWD